MDVNDLILETGHKRTIGRPPKERERFTPSQESKEFLDHCREMGYDISTIINLALSCFAPKTKSNYNTWEGVDSVISGKKKWF